MGTRKQNGDRRTQSQSEPNMTHTSSTQHAFYVGEGSSLHGADLSISGTASIDGRLIGKIEANHIIVGESGFVSGQIHADSAEVNGALEEEIVLKSKLTVMSTGRVSGSVTYDTLEVHEGARIHGTLNTDYEGDRPAESSVNPRELKTVVSRSPYDHVDANSESESDTKKSDGSDQQTQPVNHDTNPEKNRRSASQAND